MIKKVALALALGITIMMVLSLPQFAPRNNGTTIPVNSPPGKLSDFWAGNAYFERSRYLPLASDGSTLPSGFEEAAPIARPDLGPNVIYLYYRTGVLNTPGSNIDGAIGLAVSTDGGASYRVVNSGNPVLRPGSDVSPYSICDWDSEHVIAPSVVKVGGTFYMVYEGANLQSPTATLTGCDPLVHVLTFGDIGLATSSDGIIWTKRSGSFPGLFLQHNPLPPTLLTSNFECNNIGTPFIGHFNSQFFIFYHGDCGTITDPTGIDPYDLRNKIGMAHGSDTDINSVVKNTNPVMDIGAGQYSWDSRVNSRASVIQGDDGYYYMTFEGSYYVFCHQFGTSGANFGRWGWGIARTADILNGPWEKYIHNPIRQVFQNETGCGMDLPYISQFNGVISVLQRPETRDPSIAPHYDRNVLLTGQDPYLHLYPSTVQCQNYHKLGQIATDGWSASTGLFTLPDYMCYGPYETSLPPGKYAVNFRDLIDTTLGLPNIVFIANINDATGGCGSCNLDARAVLRTDFIGGGIYQQINEQFSATAGHSYEWRIYFENTAYVKQNEVALRQLDGSIDTTPPTSSVSPLPANSPRPFTVTWSGSDTGTGIWSYDIQFQDNGGPWKDWQPGTMATSAAFAGQCFHTYGFQSRARDNAGNVGNYPNSAQASTYVACDFGISPSPASLNLLSGNTASSSLSINAINGLNETVNLSCSVAPSMGPSCSVNPSTVSLSSSATGTSTLTISTISSTPTGSYTVTVTGTSGPVTHSITVAVLVQAFSISASPNSLVQQAGSPSGTTTLTLTSGPAFSGTVTLSAAVVPAGPSTSLNPITVTLLAGGTGTSTLTVSTVASTVPGTYTITVTGTSGVLSSSTSIGLQVTVPVTYVFPATFTQTGGVSGSNVIALVGTPVSISTTIASTGTVSGTLSVEVVRDFGFPFVFTYAVNNVPVTLNGGLNTVSMGSFTPLDLTSPLPLFVHDYYIRVSWNGVTIYNPDFAINRETVQTTLQEFTMYANPTSLGFLGAATSGSSTITIGSVNLFAGTVNLSVSASPVGLSCSLTTYAVNPPGTSTLTCSGAPGSYTVVVTGTSGSLTRLVSIPVTVFYRDLAVTSLSGIGTSSRGVVTLSALVLNSGTNPESSVAVSFYANGALIGTVVSNTPLAAGQTVTVNIAWNGTALPLGSFTVKAHVEPTLFDVNTVNNDIIVAGSVSDSTLSYNGYTGDLYSVLVGGPAGTMTLTVVNSAGVTSRGTVPVSIGTGKFVAEIPTGPFWLGATCNVGVSGTSGCVLGKTLDVAYRGNSYVDIIDVSLAAALYGTTTSSPNWNPAVDLNSDGAVNILDVSLLGANFGDQVVQFALPILSLSAQPATIAFPAGSSTTTTITANSLNGFAGALSVTATSAPSGSTCTTATVSLTAGGPGMATLTCSGTTPGFYAITVGASGSNGLGNFVVVHLTITDFAVSANPTTVSFIAGTSASSTITVSSINGFSGTVNLSSSPTSPVSTTCPVSVTLSSNVVSVTCTFSSSTGGTFTITITGTGSVSHSTTETVNVQDFTITANPTTVSFNSGTSGSTSLILASVGTFSGNVTLTAPSPLGLQVACTSQVTLVSGGTAPSSCMVSSTTPGTYSVTISAASAGRTHTATVTVNVGDFSISANPASQNIFKGSSTTATVSLNSLYSFSGSITLTVSVSPQFNGPPSAGLSATSLTISPSSPGTATVNFSTFSNTTKTTYTVTVTATSGSIVHTATFTVTVN